MPFEQVRYDVDGANPWPAHSRVLADVEEERRDFALVLVHPGGVRLLVHESPDDVGHERAQGQRRRSTLGEPPPILSNGGGEAGRIGDRRQSITFDR